jgi:TolA-binding protein
MLPAMLSCRARGEPSEGSIFSSYRSCLKAGDSSGALTVLTGLSHQDSTLDAELANFALAWRAFERQDTHEVSQVLTHRIPNELSDHALWLRAQVSTVGDDLSRSRSLWEELADDTSSVYAEEALLELTQDAARQRDTTAVLGYIDRQQQLSAPQRTASFDLMLAETYSNLGRHVEATQCLSRLAVDMPYTAEGRTARGILDDYLETYDYRPKPETDGELAREFDALAGNNKPAWGLDRVNDLFGISGWQRHNDLLLYYKGRFESGLGRYKAAVQDLQNHHAAYPKSEYAYSALYFLGRSAYLTDNDSVAIASLTAVAEDAADTVLKNQALEVLGLLYMDRHRPLEAVAALQRWSAMSQGRSSHADALWRLGWALWETQDYRGARQIWQELASMNLDSEYTPASLYWVARAAEKIGDREETNRLFRVLDSTYTYSYYAIIRRDTMRSDSVHNIPLAPPTLDDLCVSQGPHTRKFGMLAALELTVPALKEWPAAQRELPDSPGFDWWKTQVLYWGDQRMDAWRTMRASLGRFIQTAGARPTDFYSIAYPVEFADTVKKYATGHSLDPFFVFGVICQESHFEKDVVSAAGAIGLMQLMPATASLQARSMDVAYSPSQLYRADYNIQLGTAHLADLMKEFNSDTVLVLAAYNAGKDIAHAWQAEFGDRPRDEFIEDIPYRETRLFVKRIMEHIAAYRRLYPDAFRQSQG